MKKKTAGILHFIEVVIVIVAVVIFLLANPKTLNYLADTVTSKYHLKYKELSGNILTNIHIKDITYHDKLLSKEADIDFNLLKLLIFRLDIEKVEFLKVDMQNLKEFINDFDKEKPKSQEQEETKSGSLPIKVTIQNIILDVLPYKKDELEIQKLKLNVKDFSIDSNIDVGNVSVKLLSNYFDLKYNGSYKSHKLFIKNMNVSKLDMAKILLLKDIVKSDSESNSSIIKAVRIDSASLTTKPFKKGKYKIDSFKLFLKDLTSDDMKLFDIKNIDLDIKTNIWSMISKGSVKNSVLDSKVSVNLKDRYFKKFVPFFDFNTLNPVDVKLKIDKDRLIGDVKARSKKLLTKDLDKKVNLKVKSMFSHAVFDFKTLSLDLNTTMKLSTKYAEDIKLDGKLLYDKENFVRYFGDFSFTKYKNIDKRLKKLLKDAKVEFKGDTKGIRANLKSDYLTGEYISKNGFLKPSIQISSKEFYLSELEQNLTKKLEKAKLSFDLKTVLDYKNIKNAKIDYTLNSNLADAKGYYDVKKHLVSFISSLSKNTILKDKKIKYENIFPIKTTVDIKKDLLDIKASNDLIKVNSYYKDYKDFNLTLTTTSSNIDLSKKSDKIFYDINITLFEDFVKEIRNFYEFTPPKLNGAFDIKGTYENKTAKFSLNSKWMLYEYAKYKYFFVEDADANFIFDKNILTINNYSLNAYILDRYRKLYSSKESQLILNKDKKDLILYVNDAILVKGEFSDSVNLDIKAKNYHINEPEANLFTDIYLKFISKNNISSLTGKIKLLSGVIKYKPKNSYEVNDPDIIFVNKKKKKKDNGHFNININILTKNKISYEQDKNRFDFTSDLTLLKLKKQNLQIYGYLKVIDGVYFSDDKRFDLGSGEILFAGDLLNPYLNLKAYYKKDPYNITIVIGGRLESPILNFSSTPYLTQNDILSVLLFNTKASSLTDSENQNSNPALSLFGSSFAKGMAKTLGIKLDRIDLTTTKEGSIGFELEKRISKRTTIIYQNDLVQTIKVKYQNTQNIETDLIFSPDSSGIDIIYKNEK